MKWTMKPGSEKDAWHVVDPWGSVRVFNESYTVASNIVEGCNDTRMQWGECGDVSRVLLESVRPAGREERS